MNRIRKMVLMLIIVLGLLSGGCWSRLEVDDRAIVSGEAIDKALEEEKVMVTVEIVNPKQLVTPLAGGGGGDEPVSWVLSSTGWTIYDAFRNFNQQSRERLFLAHSQIILIGEELAREGLASVLDFYIRDREIRWVSWVIITKGVTGKEIMSVEYFLKETTGKSIVQLVEASQINSTGVKMSLVDFVGAILDGSQGAVAGRIELIDSGKPEGILAPDEGNISTENPEESSKKNEKKKDEPETLNMKQNLVKGELLRYTGAAIFKGDKLVDWLDRKQTRGYNWVMGKVVEGVIVVSSPEKGKPKISIDVKEASSKISTQFVGTKPHVKIEVKVDGNIGDHMGNRAITEEPELMSQVEARMAQVVRNEIEAALAITQKHETDIFNFGGVFNRQHYQQWQKIKDDWQEMFFPNLVVEIVVNASIRRTGMIAKPIVPQ